MKGERITSVNPLVGALSAFEMMKDQALGKDVSGRATSLTDELEGITVDTCCPSDTCVWETGIKREKIEGEWVIVSQYVDKEKATKGHKQWVELMKLTPDCKLKDIDMWNLGL